MLKLALSIQIEEDSLARERKLRAAVEVHRQLRQAATALVVETKEVRITTIYLIV